MDAIPLQMAEDLRSYHLFFPCFKISTKKRGVKYHKKGIFTATKCQIVLLIDYE